MESDSGLRFAGVLWALIFGLATFPILTAMAWSRRSRYRWLLAILTMGYVISMLVFLLNLRH